MIVAKYFHANLIHVFVRQRPGLFPSLWSISMSLERFKPQVSALHWDNWANFRSHDDDDLINVQFIIRWLGRKQSPNFAVIIGSCWYKVISSFSKAGQTIWRDYHFLRGQKVSGAPFPPLNPSPKWRPRLNMLEAVVSEAGRIGRLEIFRIIL